MISPSVKILASCRSPELARMTTLVFETLRIGFPTAKVTVYLNGSTDIHCPEIVPLLNKMGIYFEATGTIHHEWIQRLVETEKEPFFTLDTDVIFYENFERFTFDQPIAGFRVPEWRDEFSGCITRSRLHPSLMYFDQKQISDKLQERFAVCPDTPFTPKANVFNPVITPLNGRLYFHDTCSLLYHSIGGQTFTDEQKDAYFHFNFGTIPDLVLTRLNNGRKMEQARAEVLANPQLGRGMWRAQEAYYSALKPMPLTAVDLPAITPEDAKAAYQWNVELCLGDNEAMECCDLWYKYVHLIDDILDTRQDGRPIMSDNQLLEVFAIAAAFYNCTFFVKHRHLLFPIVLLVTNQYADSVEWERSPLTHRRMMADCLRCCGDEFYFMIAMIKGGWSHVRNIGPRIRERDFVAQHDSDGRPI